MLNSDVIHNFEVIFFNFLNCSKMKRLVLNYLAVAALALSAALICGTVFTGCSDKEEPKKTAEGLYVIGANSGTKSATDAAGDKTDLVFTGDDIISFNVSNGEIVFAETTKDEIISRVSHHTELHFFIDDKAVFTPPIRIHFGWALSFDDFDLQFRTDGARIFLTDVFMSLDSVPYLERKTAQSEIEAKKERREAELDVLIEYLRKAGKIAEQEIELPEVIRKGCDILYFADSIKLESRTINWEIKDTRITAVYPAGADLSAIAPFVIVSERAIVNPKSGEKTDFSNERVVVYTVTAEDGTKKIYKAQATTEKER